MASPEILEVIRWNRKQAAGAREMAARARAAGRDEDAVLRRELYAVFHDQVADRAEKLAATADGAATRQSLRSSAQVS